jgi:hypothetical protein
MIAINEKPFFRENLNHCHRFYAITKIIEGIKGNQEIHILSLLSFFTHKIHIGANYDTLKSQYISFVKDFSQGGTYTTTRKSFYLYVTKRNAKDNFFDFYENFFEEKCNGYRYKIISVDVLEKDILIYGINSEVVVVSTFYLPAEEYYNCLKA